MKKKIVIKQGKDGYHLKAHDMKDSEIINILLNFLAFEVCTVRSPVSTPDTLWATMSGHLLTAIQDHYTALYGGKNPPIEWEKVS